MGVGSDWHPDFLAPVDISGQVKNKTPPSPSSGRTGPISVYTQVSSLHLYTFLQSSLSTGIMMNVFRAGEDGG